MKKIMTIILGISLFLEASFHRDNSKGIVTDSITKLQWQDDYRPHNPEIRRAEWADAIDYCNDLTLGGFSDWRLPNINELSSIQIFKISSPTISNQFVYIKSRDYWSSTTSASSSDYAWFADFSGGGGQGEHVKNSYSHYVRCVRGEY